MITMSSINTQKIALRSIKTKPPEEIRLFSRHLSQDLSIVDTPLDVYYRESRVGVPFLWESQPGTPKIKSRESSIPPLTPPPSFHASPISRKPLKKQPRSTSVFLPRLKLKKSTQFERSPPRSTSSSSSSPWSTTSSPLNEVNQRRFSSPPRMSLDSRIEEDDECESPVSTLCFRGGRSAGAGGRSRGCSSTIVSLLLREFS